MKTVSFLTLALTAAAIASPLTWERLIESAKADPRYEAAEKRAEATAKERNLKLWDKVELRYQLDGFSFAKHDFELRVTPQAFGERAADKAHYEAVKNYQQATFAVERSILLYDRYERGVRYVLRQKINEINKQLLQVTQDRIEVLHLKSGSASFNAEDLMTSLEKSASLKANLLSDSTALRDAELKMLSWAPDYDNVALDSSFLPSMEELAEFLKNGVTVDENFPLVALAKGKRDSDISKAEQDASKDRNYISHIGIGYSLQVESLMEKYKDLEYKDVKRIREFVIALDTSESVSGDVVQQFVTKTWNILKQSENFFSRVNVHIIQCGARVEEDVRITTQDEFDEYIRHMVLKGFGGTDFRPVFEKVEELRGQHFFENLKGLIYFTDGYGTYPDKPTDYDTAFVFIEDSDYEDDKVPDWALKLYM